MWYFPGEKFIASTVLDYEAFNKDTQAWADEADGNLNEQNFVATIGNNIVSHNQAASDIAIRNWSKKKLLDPHAATNTLWEVPQGTRWVAVDDTGGTFASRGGLALVIIGFQMRCPNSVSGSAGMIFCIEVDGVPRMDTLLGSGDMSNDYLGLAWGATSGGGEVSHDWDSAPAFRGRQEKKQVKGLFRLSTGDHTIRLLVRNITDFASGASSQFISQRETILLDLWA